MDGGAKRDHVELMIEKEMGSDGETGVYGACKGCTNRDPTENGVVAGPGSHQFIGSGAGEGDRRVDQVREGTAAWQRVIGNIHYAVIRCETAQFLGATRRRFWGVAIRRATGCRCSARVPRD